MPKSDGNVRFLFAGVCWTSVANTYGVDICLTLPSTIKITEWLFHLPSKGGRVNIETGRGGVRVGKEIKFIAINNFRQFRFVRVRLF